MLWVFPASFPNLCFKAQDDDDELVDDEDDDMEDEDFVMENDDEDDAIDADPLESITAQADRKQRAN